MSLNSHFSITLEEKLSLSRKKTALGAAEFETLFEPLKLNLYNFIFKALNFSEDADDVFQETLLRAVKYLASFRRDGSFKTWIFTIAHNEIKKYYKKNKGKSSNPAQSIDQLDIAGDMEDPDKELVAEIFETASRLNPSQRKVFFLFYDQQFSIQEIEQITDLKEGNIKFILNRAREQVKERLGVKAGGKSTRKPGVHHER